MSCSIVGGGGCVSKYASAENVVGNVSILSTSVLSYVFATEREQERVGTGGVWGTKLLHDRKLPFTTRDKKVQCYCGYGVARDQ